MKRILILILALIPFISSCKKDGKIDPMFQIREIAWNYLDVSEGSYFTTDWREAPVTESVYNEKSVYAVIFNTIDDALLGPITIYIDKTSLAVLGEALRL